MANDLFEKFATEMKNVLLPVSGQAKTLRSSAYETGDIYACFMVREEKDTDGDLFLSFTNILFSKSGKEGNVRTEALGWQSNVDGAVEKVKGLMAGKTFLRPPAVAES